MVLVRPSIAGVDSLNIHLDEGSCILQKDVVQSLTPITVEPRSEI